MVEQTGNLYEDKGQLAIMMDQTTDTEQSEHLGVAFISNS